MTVVGFKERPRHFFSDPRPRRGRHVLAPRDPANPAAQCQQRQAPRSPEQPRATHVSSRGRPRETHEANRSLKLVTVN